MMTARRSGRILIVCVVQWRVCVRRVISLVLLLRVLRLILILIVAAPRRIRSPGGKWRWEICLHTADSKGL